MNAIQSIIAAAATVAAFAGTSAFAQEATPDTWVTQARSVASREAVHADAVAAVAAGKVAFGEAHGHDFWKDTRSVLTRAQVVAEAIEAQRLGVTQVGEVTRVATAAENDRIRMAGQRALSTTQASR